MKGQLIQDPDVSPGEKGAYTAARNARISERVRGLRGDRKANLGTGQL